MVARAVMHFTDFISHTRVKQDALGRSRLAGINVRHDPDVASVCELCFPWHFEIYFYLISFLTSDNARKPCSLPPYGEHLPSS